MARCRRRREAVKYTTVRFLTVTQDIGNLLHRCAFAEQSACGALTESMRVVALPTASVKCRYDGPLGQPRQDGDVIGCDVANEECPARCLRMLVPSQRSPRRSLQATAGRP